MPVAQRPGARRPAVLLAALLASAVSLEVAPATHDEFCGLADSAPAELGSHLLLLQTGLHFEGRQVTGPAAVASSDLGSNALAGCHELLGSGGQYWIEVARQFRLLPHWDECETVLQKPVLLSFGGHLLPQGRNTWMIDGFLIIFLLGWAVVMFHMVAAILAPDPGTIEKAETATHRPEQACWDSSFLSWSWMGWAGPWMAQWGSAASTDATKIHASSLGRMGTAEDESSHNGDTFERLWQECIQEKGVQGTSLVVVAWRFLTWKRYMVLGFTSCMCEVLQLLGPTFALDYILTALANLAKRRMDPGYDDSRDKSLLTLVGVGAFTLMPMFMIMFGTISYMVGIRMGNRLRCALLVSAYRKALRLPAGDADFDLGPEAGNQRYNIVQLLNADCNSGPVVDVFTSVYRVLFTVPIMAVLFVKLMAKLKGATVYGVLTMVALMVLTHLAGKAQVEAIVSSQVAGAARIAKSQEVMYAIRVIKSYAWEDDAERRLKELRDEELRHLSRWYRRVGSTNALLAAYPRLLLLGGLGSFVAIYGNIPAADIFILLQVMGAFNGALAIVSGSLPILLQALPLLYRIERFFKLPEAAAVTGRTLTPAAEDGEAQALSRSVRLKGSFSWTVDGEPVLKDIDLSLASGSLVAVVGEVGSGKSALVHGLLNELVPQGECELEVPGDVAYHAQVPFICEGTLKQNVVFWRGNDEARYQQALTAACLSRDLEILPGGDEVPVGTRGVSLSGGQRARVSLARVGFSSGAGLVLLDDPFGAVDAPTADYIFNRLLRGPLLQGLTRVVVLQPHMERIMRFDHVIVLASGRVAAQGQPTEVMKHPAFRGLLQSGDLLASPQLMDTPRPDATPRVPPPPPAPTTPQENRVRTLREEEFEGRAGWDTVMYYCGLGGRQLLAICCLFLCINALLGLLGDLVLARWSATSLLDPQTQGSPYILAYLFWVCLSTGAFLAGWSYGVSFTLNISRGIHESIIKRLLLAPIDRFHDKHPVGRILNRLTTDLNGIDYYAFSRITLTISVAACFFTPTIYVHWYMPLWFSLLCLPFYTLMAVLVRRYWAVAVPLRYLSNTTRSRITNLVSEVHASCTTIRAYKVQEHVCSVHAETVDEQIKVDWAAFAVQRFLQSRLGMLYGLFCTIVVLMGIWMHQLFNVGTISLCITCIVSIITKLEMSVDQFTQLQYTFVAVNRLHEYTTLPEERALVLADDNRFAHGQALIARSALGDLRVQPSAGGLIVSQADPGHVVGPLLEGTAHFKALRPVPGRSFQSLAPANRQLAFFTPRHLLVSANGKGGSAEEVADELCAGSGQDVHLKFSSDWLMGGAKVVVSDLVAGYADIREDVLKGVSLVVEPRMKAALCGTTGCGKSTLLLCLLRILEPRGGRVEINGVDTAALGLRTLRRGLGLVPQDPLLFSGSLRSNLDPFDEFTDAAIWQSLAAVQLEATVQRLESESGSGLLFRVEADGKNVSFGQRQLLCIARMILRQPGLLLLDECTSAIDPRTQELVQKTIESQFPESTIIAVAHRLETILDFNMVFVMDQGYLVEKGHVQELVKLKGGLFARMVQASRRAPKCPTP